MRAKALKPLAKAWATQLLLEWRPEQHLPEQLMEQVALPSRLELTSTLT